MKIVTRCSCGGSSSSSTRAPRTNNTGSVWCYSTASGSTQTNITARSSAHKLLGTLGFPTDGALSATVTVQPFDPSLRSHPPLSLYYVVMPQGSPLHRDIPPELEDELFSRNRFFFEEGFEDIRNALVIVVGLGGVGSHAAHMLVSVFVRCWGECPGHRYCCRSSCSWPNP